MTQAAVEAKLYDRDFNLWIADTITKLKDRNFDQLDLENLIEEIESLARRDRRELESRLDVLLNHLLKRCHIPTPENYRGWELTIREQRKQLRQLLEQSPSLQEYFLKVFDKAWEIALLEARQDYPDFEFPNQWKFDREIESILTAAFWQAE